MSPDLIDNLQSARDRLMPKVTACWGDAFDGDFDSMLDAINAMKRYAANIEQDRAAFRQLTEQRAALLEALRKAQGLIAGVGYPADSSGRYHKDGAWTFDEAVPDHTNASAIESAFEVIGSAIANATQQRNATGGEG